MKILEQPKAYWLALTGSSRSRYVTPCNKKLVKQCLHNTSTSCQRFRCIVLKCSRARPRMPGVLNPPCSWTRPRGPGVLYHPCSWARPRAGVLHPTLRQEDQAYFSHLYSWPGQEGQVYFTPLYSRARPKRARCTQPTSIAGPGQEGQVYCTHLHSWARPREPGVLYHPYSWARPRGQGVLYPTLQLGQAKRARSTLPTSTAGPGQEGQVYCTHLNSWARPRGPGVLYPPQ